MVNTVKQKEKPEIVPPYSIEDAIAWTNKNLTKEQVKEIQNALRTLGIKDEKGKDIVVDGGYKEKTAFAVAEFQRRKELPVNGKAEKETLEALRMESSKLKEAKFVPPVSKAKVTLEKIAKRDAEKIYLLYDLWLNNLSNNMKEDLERELSNTETQYNTSGKAYQEEFNSFFSEKGIYKPFTTFRDALTNKVPNTTKDLEEIEKKAEKLSDILRGEEKAAGIKEFEILKARLISEENKYFSDRISKLLYGVGIVEYISELEKIFEDIEFKRKKEEYKKDTRFDQRFLDFDLRSQYYFLNVVKPIMEEMGIWTPERINEIAEHMKFIDKVGQVEFFKTALPSIVKNYPEYIKEIIVACGAVDDLIRERIPTYALQNEKIREYYKSVPERLRKATGSAASHIINEMKKWPEEDRFSIELPAERIKEEYVGFPRITLARITNPNTYFPFSGDYYYIHLKLFGEEALEAIPSIYPRPKPIIELRSLAAAVDALVDISDLEVRKIEPFKRVASEAGIDTLYHSKTEEGKEVIHDSRLKLDWRTYGAAASYAKIAADFDAIQLNSLKELNVEAANYYYITYGRCDWKKDDYVNSFLNVYIPDSKNFSILYNYNEDTEKFEKRGYVRWKDRWIRVYSENISEEEGRKEFARYSDGTTDLRGKRFIKEGEEKEEKLMGWAVGTTINDAITFGLIRNIYDSEIGKFEEEKKKDFALGTITKLQKNLWLHYKYFRVREEKDFVAGLQGREWKVTAGEDNATLIWLREKGYVHAKYFKTLDEYGGMLEAKEEWDKKRGFLTYLATSLIAKDKDIKDTSTIGVVEIRGKKLQMSYDDKNLVTTKYVGKNIVVEGVPKEDEGLFNVKYTHKGEKYSFIGKINEYIGGGFVTTPAEQMLTFRTTIFEKKKTGIGWMLGIKDRLRLIPQEYAMFMLATTGEEAYDVLKKEEEFKRNLGFWIKLRRDGEGYLYVDKKTLEGQLYDRETAGIYGGYHVFHLGPLGISRWDIDALYEKEKETAGTPPLEKINIERMRITVGVEKPRSWRLDLSYVNELDKIAKTKEVTVWGKGLLWW